MAIRVVFCILFLAAKSGFCQDLSSEVEAAWAYAQTSLKNSMGEIGQNAQRHPSVTNNIETDGNGRWQTSGRSGWTSGFFSGCLWQAFNYTGDSYWVDRAERWNADLKSQQNNAGDHDIGFRMFCSYGNAYKLTGKEEYKQIILTSANTLASRFNEQIGCIKSWDWTGNYAVIIDNMMNLELLFWAAKNGGANRLYEIAVSHAEKTMANHVRADGSTYHVVDYNNNGTVRSKSTHQGYNDESTWSRGQAWGLYGFTMAYRETGDDRFLQTARKLADYFIDHLPDDWVPFSDFEAPEIPNLEKDASAAAIACSGLFELSVYLDDTKYYDSAVNILQSLMTDYLAEGIGYSSVLYRGCVRYNDPERGTIYGDYYFLQALQRYQDSLAAARETGSARPHGFVLHQNYPNPFNASTTISFDLDRTAYVNINVYNHAGQMLGALLSEEVTPGHHQIQWDASTYSSGVYFISITGDDFSYTRKCLLIK